jgi:hypothetical protein
MAARVKYGGRETRTRGSCPVATYRMVYGDDDQVVTETYENVESVEREDGWLVLFRDGDAIIRVEEIHVRSFERVS